ncbi:MAG: hypothetical protein ACYS8W_06230 [Planctomycetota bacterium]|jgi:hypothetical protein
MNQDYPDREELRKRRETYAADRIHSTMIGAGKRPIRWWGPFDAGDALGRISLALGVWLIGILAHAAMDSPDFRSNDILDFVTMLFVTAFLMLPVLSGIGILAKKYWGVIYFRLTIGLLALPAFFFFIAVLAEEYMFELQGIGLMCVPFLFSFYHLWTYWKANHVRYQFTYLRHRHVEKDLFRTTKGAGTPFGLLLFELPIAAAIWTNMVSEGDPDNDMLTASIIVGLLFGIFVAVSGFAFRARVYAGRICMITASVILLAGHALFSVIATANQVTLVQKAPALKMTSMIMETSVGVFGLAIPAYALFEMLRFLLSDKVKAWCRVGTYTPPWREQLRIIEERERQMESDGPESI